MHKRVQEQYFVHPQQLQVGLYVHLDLGWMDHPFSLSSFRISDAAQIATLKSLGLSRIRYDPKRSLCQPVAADNLLTFPQRRDSASRDVPHRQQFVAQKQQDYQQTLTDTLHRYADTSQQVNQIMVHLKQSPERAWLASQQLLETLVTSTLTESDMVIHAVETAALDSEECRHALNTLVLSMMLAKSAQISEEEMVILGMAAILHDIGKPPAPPPSQDNDTRRGVAKPVDPSLHVEAGVALLQALQAPQRLLKVVAQHHAFADGSGYPLGLQHDAIDPLAHLLIIVNLFDELCHPANPEHAKSPYEALSVMFSRYRKQLHERSLRWFIKDLGIYPPGSVVRLSNGWLARVISTNPQYALRPFVQVISHTQTARDSILDLREHLDLHIVECLKSRAMQTLYASQSATAQPTGYMLNKSLSTPPLPSAAA